jgi:hypothetical protein
VDGVEVSIADLGFVEKEKMLGELLEETFSFGKYAVPRTSVGKFLEFQGYSYAAAGIGFATMPQLFVMIGLVPAFSNLTEQAYFRSVGFVVGLVGYFYITCARSESKTFQIASVTDRWFIVPPCLIILMFCGLPVPVGMFFVIYDGGLGYATYKAIQKQEQEQGKKK